MEEVRRCEQEEMDDNPGGSGRMQHVHRSTAAVGAGLEVAIRQIRHMPPCSHHEGSTGNHMTLFPLTLMKRFWG